VHPARPSSNPRFGRCAHEVFFYKKIPIGASAWVGFFFISFALEKTKSTHNNKFFYKRLKALSKMNKVNSFNCIRERLAQTCCDKCHILPRFKK
jgi:hypothetical protein